MQNVNIRTAQNVKIDYRQAGLGERMGAFFVDSLIMLFYLIAAFYLIGKSGIDSLWIGMTAFLPVFLYHLLSELFLNGQSLGKMQFNIKVVKLDGTPPNLSAYLLRWLLRPIDISIFTGGVAVIAIAMSKNGQRLGDMAAGTTVVKVKQPHVTTSHELIKDLQEDYKVTFNEAYRLSDSQVQIIKDALKVNRNEANARPVIVLARKVQDALEVESDLPPVKFLYTVVKDYKYLTSQS